MVRPCQKTEKKKKKSKNKIFKKGTKWLEAYLSGTTLA
jgi:hypothetical protein